MEPLLDPEFEEMEKALLRAGREVKMSPALQAKTLAALGVGAAGVTAAATAKAGTLGWLSSKASAVWGVTLAGGVVVAGAVALTDSSPDQSAIHAPSTEVSESDSATLPPADLAPAAEDDLVPDLVEGTADEKEAPAASEEQERQTPTQEVAAPVNQRRVVSTKKSEQTAGLAQELAFLKQAEGALRAGSPSQALSHLSEYRKTIAKRQLGLEAEVLTIQALYESGSLSAARQRAARFVEKYPQSPLGVRAKQYLK